MQKPRESGFADFRKNLLGKTIPGVTKKGTRRLSCRGEDLVNTFANFDVVQRPSARFVYLEARGDYALTAQNLWPQFWSRFPAAGRALITQTLGLSGLISGQHGDSAKVYQAGVAINGSVSLPPGLNDREIPDGTYASFLLRGSYGRIGIAFQDAFQLLAARKVRLRPEFCIEHYRNNPDETPEAALLTELLIPIEAPDNFP